ncbi:MAG: DUF2520 domain-containing protein [Chloroflexi bacterium]|nr:DUF2520 domain-containing protein [Chloroflexota bacterium]MCC6896391.1 DUF2520 domain-containing protein [Anaerolineae bacterium]
MSAKPSLGFVGAGKVGTTLARLLHERGYDVGYVYSRHSPHAQGLANGVEARVAASVREVALYCDLVFLTVADDAVQSVATGIHDVPLAGKGVVHTSGMHDAALLHALADQGAMIGCLHPAFPFATVEDSVLRLPGSTFAVQASDKLLREWLDDIVRALSGQVIYIAEGKKALYHSALVFASNYGVTLYAIAQRLLGVTGASSAAADKALNALVTGMVRNIEAQGIPNALTGPLLRGDVNTITAHLEALRGEDTQLQDLYMRLAEQTLPLVEARGVDTTAIKTILRRAMGDADNNT